MTRIFLDQLRTEIDANFPDNSLGEISPADLRGTMNNTVDSVITDEAVLTQSAPVVGVVLAPNVWTIPASQFDGSIGGDGVFLKPNPAGGYVEGTTTPGFTYYILAGTTYNGPNNTVIQTTAMLDGVPFGPITETTQNGTDPNSANIVAIKITMPADGQLAMGYRVVAGATITIESAETIVLISPTNNP